MARMRYDINSAYTQAPAPAPAPPQASTPILSNFLSAFMPGSLATKPRHFSITSLPVGELLGGVTNVVRGLVLNDNWWLLLLIIFLFFPKISRRMFGSIIKD